MEYLVTYIRLTPEFGGTEFGPFEGLEIALGSDLNSCHIHIPSDFGTLPIHAKIIRQSPKDLILTPAEQAAEIFMWRENTRRPEQIYAPTAIQDGESFSLVTPEGPRFIVSLRDLPEAEIEKREVAKKVAGTGRRRLSKKSMEAEVKRQAWTSLLVTGPAQLAQRAWTFIRSGAIFQPRNIIIGLTMMSGFIFGGFMSCKSRRLQSQTVVVQNNYKDCRQDLVACQGDSDGEMDFFDAVYRLSRSEDIKRVLEDDKVLREAVKTKARSLAQMGTRSKKLWFLTGRGDYFKQYRKWIAAVNKIPDTTIDKKTKFLLRWMPSERERTSLFTSYLDAKGKDTCGRGILGLSYRQAIRLGIPAQPDAFYTGNLTAIEARETKITKIQESIALDGFAEELDPEANYNVETVKSIEKIHCLYKGEDLEDFRMDNRKLLKILGNQIGTKNIKGLPAAETPEGMSARIAKLYVADLPRQNFSDRKNPTQIIDNHIGVVLSEDPYKWAVKKTADVIARSLVLPCLISEKGKDRAKEKLLSKEEADRPSWMACMVLFYRLQNDE